MRIVKSISFNMEDPQEKELFEIANRGGFFSKNVKRMMAAYFLPVHPVLTTNQQQEEEEVDFDSFSFDDDE